MYNLFRCLRRRIDCPVYPAMKSVFLHLLCCQPDFIIRIVTGCRYPLLYFFFNLCFLVSASCHLLLPFCFFQRLRSRQNLHKFFSCNCFFLIQVFCKLMKFLLVFLQKIHRCIISVFYGIYNHLINICCCLRGTT